MNDFKNTPELSESTEPAFAKHVLYAGAVLENN